MESKIVSMNEIRVLGIPCDECLKPVKWGEKVVSACKGRRLSENTKLEINFFHKDCSKLLEGQVFDLRTVTEWKKHWRDCYGSL